MSTNTDTASPTLGTQAKPTPLKRKRSLRFPQVESAENEPVVHGLDIDESVREIVCVVEAIPSSIDTPREVQQVMDTARDINSAPQEGEFPTAPSLAPGLSTPVLGSPKPATRTNANAWAENAQGQKLTVFATDFEWLNPVKELSTVVSYAAVKLVFSSGGLASGTDIAFSAFAKPDRGASYFSPHCDVHGLTAEKLKDQPPAATVCKEFFQFIRDNTPQDHFAVLLAHNGN